MSFTCKRIVAGALVVASLVAGGACGAGTSHQQRRGQARRDTTCDGKLGARSYVTVWFHASADVGGEPATMRRQVAAFNAAQRDVRVRLITLPEGDYGEQVRSAAATGTLPDLLDFDGPNLYNYAWSGKLKPIDSCLTRAQRDDLLPSLIKQGTYEGRTWGIGTFDSGLGLYVRPSILRRAGIRIPAGIADAWTADEFTAILRRLHAMGYRHPLDLQMDPKPQEWNTYGFQPAVWSAGGDLIDRTNYRRVEGVLNGPAATRVLSIIRGWAKAGWTDPAGSGFEKGKDPISWVGHWKFDAYTKAFPGDVRIVPLPRFGRQTRTGMGSWQWGITANARDGDAVWRFLTYLLRPEEVTRMSRANGSIPGTRSAIRLSPRFSPGGPEHLYIDQLEHGIAVPRPQTPAYPTLSSAWSKAFQDVVLKLRPVKPELDAAAAAAQRDLAEHQYYRPTGR